MTSKTTYPLYVSRRLINTDEFISWAKKSGFDAVVSEKDIHVTIAYSKDPVDTIKRKPDTREISIKTGNRSVEPLGNEGAVVLHFESDYLQKSWNELKDIGASWDYDEYNPHITISYKANIDPAKVKPFTGMLHFYGEVYEPLNTDWKDSVVHESTTLLTFSEYAKGQTQC